MVNTSQRNLHGCESSIRPSTSAARKLIAVGLEQVSSRPFPGSVAKLSVEPRKFCKAYQDFAVDQEAGMSEPGSSAIRKNRIQCRNVGQASCLPDFQDKDTKPESSRVMSLPVLPRQGAMQTVPRILQKPLSQITGGKLRRCTTISDCVQNQPECVSTRFVQKPEATA
ncbi:MAG: hypothetical protein KDA96_13130, partial [Planctomycetaceae bacterium]|nr:hypothetical protein [Planctomycetaceae bacterium]